MRRINVQASGPKQADFTYKTVVLKGNASFKDQIETAEGPTKFVFRWDFDLNDEVVTVPENCILEFDGGSLKNGTIIGQDTVFINVGDVDIWGEYLTREGTWREHSGGSGGGGEEDKPYDPEHHSGLGRKTLQLKGDSNILTQEDFDQANTVYVIQYDFDLDGGTIEIPEGCVLDFEGGSLTNGNLEGYKIWYSETGFYHGDVAIINQPDDFLQQINCANIDIHTMRHLSMGDLMDISDDFAADNKIARTCRQNYKTTNKFYSLNGLEKIYFVGNYRYTATILLAFYDKDFFFIGRSSEYALSSDVYTFDVPEGAVYVTARFSFDARRIGLIPTIMQYIYTNFLDNTYVNINSDFTRDDKGNVIDYFNIPINFMVNVYVTSDTKKYWQFELGRTDRRSLTIPYSLFSQFDYICIKPHFDPSKPDLPDSPEADRNYPARVHFLTKEPVVNGEDVEGLYSEYWGRYRDIPADSEAVYLPIMEDVRYIVIDCFYNERHRQPDYVRLYTKENLGIDNFELSPAELSAARNTNKYSIHLMHWNIGNFSHGGNHTSIDDENYAAKRTSFINFMNRHKDYNIMLNEYNPVFANVNGSAISPNNIFPNYYTTKRFPRFNDTDQLAIYAMDSLVAYRMRHHKALKNKWSVENTPLLPKPYVIYRYFIGNTSLYVVHVHLQTRMTTDAVNAVFDEMISVVAEYSNVVIWGDFNRVGRSEIAAKFESEGYSIANDLDLVEGEPRATHVSWNHTTEEPDPNVQNTLDWCVYRGSFTVNFHVCLDAVDNGAEEGDVEHMLSDHWPIAITIERDNTSVVPADTGNYKWDNSKNLPLWCFGDGNFYTALHNIECETLADALTFVPGLYKVSSSSAMGSLENNNKLPISLQDYPAGFVMQVFRFSTTRVAAFIIPFNNGMIYIGFSNTTQTTWESWSRYEGITESISNRNLHIGDTASRPSFAAKPWFIGFCYIDTTLGKPIWWTGDTSDGKTGWVDATGANV